MGEEVVAREGRPGFSREEVEVTREGRPRFFAGEAAAEVVVCFGSVVLFGGRPWPRFDGVSVTMVAGLLEGELALVLLGGRPRPFLTGVWAFLGGISRRNGWWSAWLNFVWASLLISRLLILRRALQALEAGVSHKAERSIHGIQYRLIYCKKEVDIVVSSTKHIDV